MYIHASSGAWYDHSYSFMPSSKAHVNDHYFIGKPNWIDRLAIARITVDGDAAIRRQNRRFYSGLALTCIVVLAGLWLLAVTTHLVVLAVLAIGATIFSLILNLLMLMEDSIDMYHPSVSHAPSVKAAEWWLTHGPHRHHMTRVSESRVLRLMATGKGNATSDINTDNRMVYRWYQDNAELKPEIDQLLLDEEICELDLLLRNRPAIPSDDDREMVSGLKRQLDAKVSAFATSAADRAAARLAAEEAEADRIKAEADRIAQEAVDKESARTDAWRQRSARMLGSSQE